MPDRRKTAAGISEVIRDRVFGLKPGGALPPGQKLIGAAAPGSKRNHSPPFGFVMDVRAARFDSCIKASTVTRVSTGPFPGPGCLLLARLCRLGRRSKAAAIRGIPVVMPTSSRRRPLTRSCRQPPQAWHLLSTGNTSDANQARPAGGLLSDGRTPGTDARGEVSCGFKTHSSAGGVDLPA